MVDIDLVVHELRRFGHDVGPVFPVPENAGDWELTVDGNILPLEEARRVLAEDVERKPN
jgi:hypothetical protein